MTNRIDTDADIALKSLIMEIVFKSAEKKKSYAMNALIKRVCEASPGANKQEVKKLINRLITDGDLMNWSSGSSSYVKLATGQVDG